jgi:hypothetical protein
VLARKGGGRSYAEGPAKEFVVDSDWTNITPRIHMWGFDADEMPAKR